MKLARLFLAAVTISTLAACSDSVTGPKAEPSVKPSADEICTTENTTQTCRTGQTGSGG